MKIIKNNRSFGVGKNNEIIMTDKGSVHLNNNEFVTFKFKKSEFDVSKKNWGYYATPSINGRLKKFNFRTFYCSNSLKKTYILLVHKDRINEFKKYIKSEKMKIIKELSEHKF
jgi:hypothetical protein